MKGELPTYLNGDELDSETLRQLNYNQRFIHGLVKFSVSNQVDTRGFFQQQFERAKILNATSMPFSIDREVYVEMGIDPKTVYTAQPNECLPYLAYLSSNNAKEATLKMATIRGVNLPLIQMLFEQLYE